MSQSHFTDAARRALLQWINTFQTRSKAESFDNLYDGLLFGEVLELVATTSQGQLFDTSSLNQTPSSRSEQKENLERVYRGLASLLRQEETVQLAPSPSKFRPIIENPNEDGMCEFICAFVAAACLGPLAEKYVPNIMQLDKSAQAELVGIITPMKEKVDNAPVHEDQREDVSWEPSSNIASRDPDLEREELMAQKQGEIEKLKKQNADLNTRLENLLEKHAFLNQSLRTAQIELETQRLANTAGVPKVIKQLEDEKQTNIAMIDELQDQLRETEAVVEKLQRQNGELMATAERVKELDDQVRILEHRAREHSKTERVLEKYKAKAQEITTYQNKVRELQNKNEELQNAAYDSERSRLMEDSQRATIEKYMEEVAKREQELHAKEMVQRHLQDTINELRTQVNYYEQQRKIDEGHIKDLEERLQMGGALSTSSSPTRATAAFSLEQELETTTSDESTKLRMEVSRLKAENNVLRNNMTVQAEAERLRTELDAANRKNDNLEVKYNETFEKQAVAQEQLNALNSGIPGDRDEAFVNMRNKHVTTLEALNKSRDRIQKLEATVADRERELQAAKTDLSAVGQEGVAALEVLKSSDQLVSRSLKSELEATRKLLETKTEEEDLMRKQLMDALVSKDKLRELLDQANAGASVASPEADEAALKSKKDDLEKNEKLRSKLKQTVQQLEKSEQDKYELQRKLKAAESGGALAAQKAASDQIIKNLQRENAMITTAWYDLTSRLQSNHVVLQRRHEVPRSWLNKQRQMVNATPRR